jgi:DNA-binding beta-propeller fold protein YncE
MPQCFARKRRFALKVFFVFLVFIQFSCSMAELERIAKENEREEFSKEATTELGVGGKTKSRFLVFDSLIKGGKQKQGGVTGTFRRLLIGPDDEIRFERPVSVGGVDNYLYIVDAGLRVVFLYDLVTQEVEPIGNVRSQFEGDPGGIYVARDRTFYIADPVGKRVIQFDQQGNVKQVFQDLANLSRPMDVTVDDTIGDVYVADGSYSHILVFNEFGKAMRAVGQRGNGPGRFRAITAMTMGPEGLYVLDRLETPVQVMSPQGEFKYAFGESYQVFPTAIAVTDERVVYVADKSDNTIRIYQDAELLGTAGGTGSAPGRFRLITGMWINGDLLYVADSLNRRVQVMRISSQEPVPAALTM